MLTLSGVVTLGRKLLQLFEPDDCYCRCHFGGYKRGTVIKGGYEIVCCEHCSTRERVAESGKWGTAIPSKVK